MTLRLAQVLYRGRKRVAVPQEEDLLLLPRPARGGRRLGDLLNGDDPVRMAHKLSRRAKRVSLHDVSWLPPINRQEVWAAGVTYRRSEVARKEESQTASSFYDAVYRADRPELFFKATPHRVVGHEQPIRIRRDAKWNVPEPELTLVLNAKLAIVGYTIGNDVSSRDIEGENPLYLPQAKIYDGSCALGPCITLADPTLQPKDWSIRLRVVRGGAVVFQGETTVGQMARELSDLVSWLGRACHFPNGAFLLTGTGIVPPKDFTLAAGDRVEIDIDQIGTLRNHVASE
jgi:2-dehydro-3-deoxy-D-arabinonate dehydratase